MSTETIVRAKPEHKIWILSPNSPSGGFELVDVMAWAVGPHGPPIPVTILGRLDKGAEYMLSTEFGWVAFPSGQNFTDSSSVLQYLRSRHVAA